MELFPEGFEERDAEDTLELSAYTDGPGEARLRSIFGHVWADDVAPGWETRWREFHRGLRVGRLWVGPPWEQAPAGVTAVLIDPGQAFGTGMHPTTRLCLQLLSELPRTSLLDVGCGSGVVGIAAAKLGFAPVQAVDSDPAAVTATAANAALNHVEIDVVLADALAGVVAEAGTTVANLTLEGVTALSRRVTHGLLVTSGYLTTDPVQLTGRRAVEARGLDGWAAHVWTPETA